MQVRRVTDHEARELLLLSRAGRLTDVIPIRSAASARLTMRLRRDTPEIEQGKPKTNICRPSDRRHRISRARRDALPTVTVPVLIV